MNSHTMAFTPTQQFLLDLLEAAATQSSFQFHERSRAVEWDELYTLASRHKIFPQVYTLISPYLPSSQVPIFSDAWEKHLKKIACFIAETKNIAAIAKKHKVDLVFLKGIVLSKILYDNLYSRSTGDIDTLLRDSEVARFDLILKENLYFHACGTENPFEIINHQYERLPFPTLKQYDHHEYFEYYKQVQPDVFVALELQRYLHGAVQEPLIFDFLQSSQDIQIEDMEMKTLDLNHTFLSICENTYENSEWSNEGPRLKDYFDLLSFLVKYKQDLQWSHISALASKYALLDIVKLVLEQVNEIFHAVVDEQIVTLFDPSPIPYTENSRIVLPWQNSIIHRLFDPDQKKLVTNARMLMEKSFTRENPYYTRSSDLHSLSEAHSLPDEAYSIIQDLKYGFELKYAAVTDQLTRGLFVIIPKTLYDQFERFTVSISIFHPDLTSETVAVIRTDNQFIRTCETSSDALESVPYSNDVAFYVPLVAANARKVTFNMSLIENIHKNVTHTLHTGGRHFWINRPFL
ncbi:nucleotidyltransferase family protein [Paenibacillus athensensis]|nr:nucleotidyltransferase family protein [Paenibacillus athensensis]